MGGEVEGFGGKEIEVLVIFDRTGTNSWRTRMFIRMTRDFGAS